MLLFKVSIPGRVPVKKNTQRVFGRGKFRRAVYSKAYLAWEEVALEKIRKKRKDLRTIDEYCEARFKFYFKNHQWEADVSNLCEGPQDCLETCDILCNDKLIKRIKAEKFFDDQNPRVEIELHTL